MESTEQSTLALDQIKTISFKQGMRGYNVDEVDEFLDKAAGEVDELRDQLHQLRQQLRQASERIAQLQQNSDAPLSVVTPPPAPAPVAVPVVPAPVVKADTGAGAEQVASMIAMAQQFIDQAQNEAEVKARELTTTAQERAREIINEARSRAEDEVQRLNAVKQRLSEDVEALNRQLNAERTRVTSVLTELQRWVEDSMRLEVARPSSPVAQAAPAAPAAPAPAPAAPSFADARPATPPPAPRPTIGDFVTPPRDENRP